MVSLSRRNLVGSLGALSAVAASARPRRAKAAGQTVTVWWNQGFYEAENQAVQDSVAAWEKLSGNKVDLTFLPVGDVTAKIVSAMTIGDVPDLVYSDTGQNLIVPQASWNDKLVDVSDVVDTQRAQFLQTALDSSHFYNNVLKKRSYYGVPVKSATEMIEVWRPMLEEAGYKDADIPKTWDKYYAFFETVQDKLRAKGKRIYGLGYSMATKEADSGNLFHAFLVALGGDGIVSLDGKLHADDPKVRQAAIKALDDLTRPYKKGYVPAGAINWGDVDNNNAFYAKQIVMTPNTTISIAVAQKDKHDQYYKEIITQGIPGDNAGNAVPSLLSVPLCFIPKGAKNVDGAKDFLKYFIQPDKLNNYLKQARGRWVPVMPASVKSDPFWMDPADPHCPVAVRQALVTPTVSWFQIRNPAYADVNAKQVWMAAEANITQKGWTAEKATDDALAQIKTIFEKYVIT
jgi:multiple sugar transport system substrate-binding protein